MELRCNQESQYLVNNIVYIPRHVDTRQCRKVPLKRSLAAENKEKSHFGLALFFWEHNFESTLNQPCFNVIELYQD